MEVTNDNGCSWIKDLIPRTNIKTLQSNEDCEWLSNWSRLYGIICCKKIRSIISKSKNHYS